VERLIGAGLIQRGAPLVFAHNQMVVILPSDNPGRIGTLMDLSQPGLRLILAGEQVPAGAYARQVLHNLADDPAYGAGYEPAVLRNVVSNEENVKQVVAKVQLGEADAGMVYRSDVTPSVADKLRQIEIPARCNVTAVYPIAVLSSASEPELADAFVQFVLAADGQRRLEQWGFTKVTE
jgi:molybdate transport system substrate-binding protein